jgi:(5-formylfuran-3-yl)methyl phosphate synthase
MQLLVSVRAGDEVTAALDGGADIIDAKEPARGSLGPVSPEMLRAISALVPTAVPLSAALGDFTASDAVRHAVAGAEVSDRRAPTYLKLGFAGVRSAPLVTALLAAGLEAAAATPVRPVVVPVGYADHESAHSLPLEETLRAAIAAGARAFLVDTCLKDGRGLLDWIDLVRLRTLSVHARSAGLLLAVAGSLGPDVLPRLGGIADVIGVRGAVCRGGREGSIDSLLVQGIRDLLRTGSPSLSRV